MAERHRYWSVEECGWVPSPAAVNALDRADVGPRASNAAVPVQRDTAARAPDKPPAGTQLV